MLKRWCSEHNIKWFIMLLLTDIDMQLALLWFLIVSQYRHQCCYCSKIQYWPCCHMPNFYLRARPFRHLPYYWICVCIGNANIMLLSSPKFVPASPPWKLARSAWNFNTMCKMVSIHIAAFCLLIWPRSKNYSRFSIPARHPHERHRPASQQLLWWPVHISQEVTRVACSWCSNEFLLTETVESSLLMK